LFYINILIFLYKDVFYKGYFESGSGVSLIVLTLWDIVFLSFGSVFFLCAFTKKENEHAFFFELQNFI